MNQLTHSKKTQTPPILVALAFLAIATFTATPSTGAPPEVLSQCNIGELDLSSKTDINPGVAKHFWKARLDTKGDTALYVLRLTFEPGDSSGWHSHPGLTLVTVVSGTLTDYDSSCTQHVYNAGECFTLDGNNVHLARNEGSIAAVAIAVHLAPVGVPLRTDAANPGCLNIN